MLRASKRFLRLSKTEISFNTNVRSFEREHKLFLRPFFRDYSLFTNLTSLPSYSEDFHPDASLSTTNNFSMHGNDTEIDNMYDLYSTTKFVNYIHYLNYSNSVNLHTQNAHPLSYIQVLNSFREDFEENPYGSEFLLDTSAANNNIFPGTFDSEIMPNSDLRTTNFVKLRSPGRGAIASFNALQKVYRMRFDEGRSNLHFADLSNSSVPYLFLSEKRVGFEKLLGKNRESFFSTVNYKNILMTNYSSLAPIFNTLTTYFSTIPFLLSMRSDSSRHIWFD